MPRVLRNLIQFPMSVLEWLLNNLISEPISEADFKHNLMLWDKAQEYETQQLEQAYFDGTNFETNGFGNDASKYVKQVKNEL